jgi:hypothetical protein
VVRYEIPRSTGWDWGKTPAGASTGHGRPPGLLIEQEDQWLCDSLRGSMSLLRLPAFARPRLMR